MKKNLLLSLITIFALTSAYFIFGDPSASVERAGADTANTYQSSYSDYYVSYANSNIIDSKALRANY